MIRGLLLIFMSLFQLGAWASSGGSCVKAHAEAFLSRQAQMQLEEISRLQTNRELRTEAKQSLREIDQLDEKIRNLRLKNGSWEPGAITEKRMNVLALETMILMDDMRLIDTHFAGPFAATGRAAARVLTSEAILRAYQEKITQGRLDRVEGAKLIQQEELELARAKDEFLAHADHTISLSYVLELMQESGTIVDVSSLFGGGSRLTDVHGKKVQTQVAEPQFAALESMMLSSMAMKHTENDIQIRARSVEQALNKYLKNEAVRKLIAHTREVVGPDFDLGTLSFQELSSLRQRLEPDWKSTDATIARRKATLKEQRILRWKLRLLGPQMCELLTNWIGSADAKYRKILKPLVDLVGLQYDRAVLRRHLQKILKVLSLRDPQMQLHELLENGAATAYAKPGELIVTFIRFTNAREDWNAIRNLLKESKAPLDQKTDELFEQYEKEAIQRGPLPLISPEPDPVGTVVAMSAVAGTGWLSTSGLPWLMNHGAEKIQALSSSENVRAVLHFLHLAAQN